MAKKPVDWRYNELVVMYKIRREIEDDIRKRRSYKGGRKSTDELFIKMTDSLPFATVRRGGKWQRDPQHPVRDFKSVRIMSTRLFGIVESIKSSVRRGDIDAQSLFGWDQTPSMMTRYPAVRRFLFDKAIEAILDSRRRATGWTDKDIEIEQAIDKAKEDGLAFLTSVERAYYEWRESGGSTEYRADQ